MALEPVEKGVATDLLSRTLSTPSGLGAGGLTSPSARQRARSAVPAPLLSKLKRPERRPR